MPRQKFKEWRSQWSRRCQSKETSTQNEWINLHKNLYSLTWDLNLNTVGSPNMAAYYDLKHREHRNGPIRLDNTGRTGACTCRLQGQWFHLRFQSDYLHTTLRHFVSIPLAKSLAFRKILEQKQCKNWNSQRLTSPAAPASDLSYLVHLHSLASDNSTESAETSEPPVAVFIICIQVAEFARWPYPDALVKAVQKQCPHMQQILQNVCLASGLFNAALCHTLWTQRLDASSKPRAQDTAWN